MPLLDGKAGLIVGIANDRSYAFHIAKAIIAQGGRCAFTHLPGEKNERRTRRAVEELGLADPWLVPLEAGSDADIDAAFDKYAESTASGSGSASSSRPRARPSCKPSTSPPTP